jgi:two-component system, LytTR family, response regulator
MNIEKKIFKCIIVDDDEIDRLTTHSFCKQYPLIQVIGSFSSAIDALNFAHRNEIDIMFLDIDIPDINGIELKKQLSHIPVCIFVTSHPEFAVESFEVSVLDFIVKPLKADRFATAISRAENYLSISQKASLLDHTLGGDTLFIKDGYNHFKIQLHDIIYLEALKDYTGIITANKKYSVLTPLGNLLKEPTFKNFVRIHRSYAVQKHFVTKISSKDVLINNVTLPVGRSYKEALEEFKN